MRSSPFFFALPALLACGRGPTDLPAGDETARASTAPEASPLADVQAPFVLTIEPPAALPAAGASFAIAARISSRTAWKTPATLEVTLPAGVALTSGSARETLTIAAGEIVRRFEFVADAPLDDRHTIAISVDLRDPGGAFGAHATRTFPEAAPAPAAHHAGRTPLATVPAPPIARPGARLRR